MNSAVETYAEEAYYDESSIDPEALKALIFETFNDEISDTINQLDDIYGAEGVIANNIDEFIVEELMIPDDYTGINQIIKQAIIDNDIEDDEQFERTLVNNGMDMKFLIDEGMAYFDNNVYSTRHYIVRYYLDVDAFVDYLNSYAIEDNEEVPTVDLNIE